MKSLLWLYTATLFLSAPQPLAYARGSLAYAPQFENEQLNYNADWPSGLTLGEAQLRSTQSKEGWDLELALDAALPGFALRDKFTSLTGPSFNSLQFDKSFTHGQRIAKEKVVFDSKAGTITRTTVDGGKSELSVPAGTRDGLAFLFYLRKELSQGRVPPAQTVIFGAPYQIRLTYTGAQNIRANDKNVQTDGISVSAKGPASAFSFDIFFDRDAVRTPVLVKVPLSLGTFKLELIR